MRIALEAQDLTIQDFFPYTPELDSIPAGVVDLLPLEDTDEETPADCEEEPH